MTLLCFPLAAAAATATATSLSITSGGQAVTSVAASTTVQLTAIVTANSTPITRGTVNFCYSAAPSCSGTAIAGTAQITAAGMAVVSIRPAPGSHSYKAFFAGTTAYNGSASATASLTVSAATQTGQAATSTALTYIGYPGDYTLTATVASTSGQAPTGTVDFSDLTAGSQSPHLGSTTVTGPINTVNFFSIPGTTAFSGVAPIVSGDFNGDGITDLVTSSGVLLGNGDATFRAGGTFAGGSVAAVGDFNSDGNLDIAFGGLQIFLGDGTGNFTPAAASASNGSSAIAVADFNNDGILDIATLDGGGNANIFLGVGDGTFTPGFSTLIADSNNFSYFAGGPYALVVGDFNADGNTDVAAGWISGGYYTDVEFPVTFLFGDGAGNFTTSMVVTPAGAPGNYGLTSVSGAFPEGMVIGAADVNGDGKTDVQVFYSFAACCPGTQNSGASTLLNNGDGTFMFTGVYDDLDGGNPLATATLDSNGDGNPFVAVRFDQPQLGPLEMGSAPPPGIALPAGFLSLPSGVGYGFVPGDFNGDGKTDIALGGPVATSIAGQVVAGSATLSSIALLPAGTGAHQVQATYQGDTTHQASTSNSLSLYADSVTPTVVVSGPASVVLGTPLTITVTTTSSGTVPTGQVTLYVDSGAQNFSANLTNGSASFSIPSLPAGMHSFYAYYQGDQNNNPATSNTINVTVTSSVINLTLTTTTPSITYGGALSLTAKTKAPGSVPTGTITFTYTDYSTSAILGTQTLDANGVATLNLSKTIIQAGTDKITASFAGDSHYGAEISSPLTITVARATPVFTLTASPSPAPFTVPVTFTATTNAGPQITGTVDFSINNVDYGPTPLIGGVAQGGNAELPAGNLTLTASYSGDQNYYGVSIGPIPLPIIPSLSVLPASPSIDAGTAEPVTLKLNTILFHIGIYLPPATGTVTLAYGNYKSAATPITSDTPIVVTIPANALPVGNDLLTATYSGDVNYPATVGKKSITVTKVADVTLATSTPTIAYGGALSLTATVASQGVTPTGTIVFSYQGTQLGTQALDNKGVATLNLASTTLPVGNDSITASYAGDGHYLASTSPPVTITVTKPAPALSLITTTPSIAYGGALSLTAKFTGQGALPTGVVTFQSMNGMLGSASFDANGNASLSVAKTTLPVGMDAITAAYAGDSEYGPVTLTPVTITVAKAAPAVTLTASSATIGLGGNETLTLTVPTGATGTAVFKLGSTTLGTSPIANGIATLAIAVPVAGNDSLTATYSGDGNFSSAVSSPVIIAVAPMVSLTSAASTIYSGTTDAVTITFGTGGNSTAPTGTITLSSGSFSSGATPIVASTATITIPANTLPVGNNVLTATYSGDANYPAAAGTLTVAVSSAPAPGFTLSSPSVSVMPGATTGNTVQITLTPVTGFTGTVSLTAQVTASPANATDPPTLSFGSTSPATITGGNPVTATLTISTTAQMTSKGALRPGGANPWGPASAGTTLACVLLLLWPRKKERSLLSSLRRHLPILAMLALCLGVGTACGGKSSPPIVTNPGTTAGTYSITVTGTSGSVTSSSVVTLTVQ